MSYLRTVAINPPPYRLEPQLVRHHAEIFARQWDMRAEVLLRILENSQVETRYSVLPIEEVIKPRTFKQNNDLFIEHSITLGTSAVTRCLEQGGLQPTDIDLLITVSCTGVMIPSVDAFLIERMGFRRDCKRLPITELGCAAGAVGLARANEYVKAFPNANVLVLAIELPTLTFQPKDINMAHVVSAIIFGDGVACALVSGQKDGPALHLLDNASYLFPNSARYMGFDVDGEGFHIVLDKNVPGAVRSRIGGLLTDFFDKNGRTLGDLSFHALHPAGKKVLHFIEDELSIDRSMTQATWDTLREHGNMSSASILYVLRQLMTAHTPKDGQEGGIVAFGPGFSAEMLLARWEA